jgi:hypothetical protein
MITLMAKLMKGDAKLAGQFSRTKDFWDQFFVENSHLSVEQLAQSLGGKYEAFQHQCFDGETVLAKEAMPLTCIASLYDGGFRDPDLAREMVAAFRRSFTGSEVKVSLESAILIYGLE